MFRTVVVGADDSATSARAVEAAVELVQMTDGALHIVSAYKPVSVSAASAGDEYREALRPDSSVTALLDDLAARARTRGVAVEVHDLKGDPAAAIQDIADQVGADLIVTGSRGMNRRVLSSVPNDIAHHSSCAVLIVKTD